jgi:hypothetical protein
VIRSAPTNIQSWPHASIRTRLSITKRACLFGDEHAHLVFRADVVRVNECLADVYWEARRNAHGEISSGREMTPIAYLVSDRTSNDKVCQSLS